VHRRGVPGIRVPLSGEAEQTAMGSITTRRIEVYSTLSEIVGYKAGLALTREEIAAHLPESQGLLQGDVDEWVRIRSETYEQLIASLLHRVGYLSAPRHLLPGLVGHHKYKHNPETKALWEAIMRTYVELLEAANEQARRDAAPIDLTPMLIQLLRQYPESPAREMVGELIDEIELYFHSSPIMQFRWVEWQDTVDLRELFASESLETPYGTFFDQRFIDYLHHNDPALDTMNWRKFEALAAELFDRSGFYVDIGPGRNDDGVDLRVWPKAEDRHLPPTILVQCKRYKQRIEKVVVKALYADILEAQAQSGLIVTTSALAPGAERVCVARAYPITQANRETLKQWLETLRSPYTGVFAGA